MKPAATEYENCGAKSKRELKPRELCKVFAENGTKYEGKMQPRDEEKARVENMEPKREKTEKEVCSRSWNQENPQPSSQVLTLKEIIEKEKTEDNVPANSNPPHHHITALSVRAIGGRAYCSTAVHTPDNISTLFIQVLDIY